MRWLEDPDRSRRGLGRRRGERARHGPYELRPRGRSSSRERRRRWSGEFDVIRTHGSAIPPSSVRRARKPRAIWLRATFSWVQSRAHARVRRVGVGRWLRGLSPGELLAAKSADALSFVRPGLEFERIADLRGIPARITGNGWDAGGMPALAPPPTGPRAPRFAFIGRGRGIS